MTTESGVYFHNMKSPRAWPQYWGLTSCCTPAVSNSRRAAVITVTVSVPLKFVMGLSTVDRSRGGEFDVLASPVDQDQDTSVFDKFGGRNDVRTCLDVMLSGTDMIFTVSGRTESLVNFLLPDNGEFKQLYDEATYRLHRTDVAYEFMRSRFR